nr:4-coumarate--CoA ligase 2-like [Onthophagus taurus]
MHVISRVVNSFGRNVTRRSSGVLFNSKCFSNTTFNQDEQFIKSPLGDVEIPNVNLAEYLLNHIGKFPTKIATQCSFTERKYTYDNLLMKSSNLSKSLRKKLNLQKGDVVAILLPNIPEFPICILGPLLAGLKITTINPSYTSEEIKRQLNDSNAKVLFTLVDFWGKAQEAVKKSLSNIKIITIKTKQNQSTPSGSINFQEFTTEKCDLPEIILSSPDETVFMPYSSGTTGLPKGVELSSKNIISNICQFNHPELCISQIATENHQDISPQLLPLFHIYGFATTLSMLTYGVKIITLPKFERDNYLKVLSQEKPHFMVVVPPIVIFLYASPEVKPIDLSSLRTISCGAAPLGALDEEKFRKKIGRPINVLQGYGLSETSPVVTMVPIQLQGKYPGSMGIPVPNTQIKVVSPDDKKGNHLKPNEIGEIYVKGPQVMKGYHNNPEESEKSFHDGWFKTGDLVKYNENGMFYICDRLKELIKVRGFQVPPAELEEIIRDFPGVVEAAVIGIPDEYNGELPKAFVVKKKEANVDVEKLQEFVASKVARHKHLKGGVVFVESIPKNDSGKILRRKLKELYL